MSGESFLDGRVTILLGDVRAMLKTLPDDHFDCIVTSPPYWGLRDYGTATWEGGDPGCDHRSPTMREGRNEDRAKLAGSAATNSAQLLLAHRSGCGKCGAIKVDHQIGLERTLGEHIAVMVEVFEEVKRVLKPTGTLWLNYGDCYATSPNGRSAADTKAAGNDDRTFRDKPFSTIGGFLKSKDLCMIPNRLAIALQEAGWWVRSEIIWHKSNPMPESIKDRPTTSHEKVWLLTKSERYFYDAAAVLEPYTTPENVREAKTGARAMRGQEAIRPRGNLEACDSASDRYWPNGGRNLRNVWSVPTAPFPEAHFATFPPALIDPCIKAGTSRLGNCPSCGAPWFRQTENEQIRLRPNSDSIRGNSVSHSRMIGANPQRGSVVSNIVTVGWAPTCDCPAQEPIPARVLDPFGGSGTSALVALQYGCLPTLIELNPEYAILARARIEAAFMGKHEGQRHMAKQLGKDKIPFEAGSLFAAIDEIPEAAE